MIGATLYAAPVRPISEDVKQRVVGCEHGTPTLTILAPNLETVERQEMAVVRLVRLNRRGGEGCGCTRATERRPEGRRSRRR